MSDIFDHELDAWESAINGQHEAYEDSESYQVLYNPLHYFTYVGGLKFVNETLKAYLVEYLGTRLWVPKSVCKNVTPDSAYIHTNIWYSILNKAKEAHTRENPLTKGFVDECNL